VVFINSENIRLAGRKKMAEKATTLIKQFTDVQKIARGIADSKCKHVLIVGKTGSGKTMVAREVVNLLPAMSLEEVTEVNAIHGYAGMFMRAGCNDRYTLKRPFRAPHHTVSKLGLLGNSGKVIGEVVLAFAGVLFLDEIVEFSRATLEAMCFTTGGIGEVGPLKVICTCRLEEIEYARAYMKLFCPKFDEVTM
jgi:magnesium chelatase family protein